MTTPITPENLKSQDPNHPNDPAPGKDDDKVVAQVNKMLQEGNLGYAEHLLNQRDLALRVAHVFIKAGWRARVARKGDTYLLTVCRKTFDFIEE